MMPAKNLGTTVFPEGCVGILVLEKADEACPYQVNTQFPICPEQEIRIGRDASTCHPVIHCPLVSKQHFRIYNISYEEDDDPRSPPPLVYCEDLESVNGTWVNDTLIGKLGSPKKGYLLSDDDVIWIKPHWVFRFRQKASLTSDVMNEVQASEKQYFADRYTITQRKLGTGASATVYLAYDRFTNIQMACKIVDLQYLVRIQAIRDGADRKFPKSRPLGTQKRESLAALQITKCEREVDILSKLNHPNIVSLQKAFRSENSLFLFQELATGGDLFSYLQSQGGKLNDLYSRVISRQIALALQYLHAQGIAHRDLKTENILVTHTDIGHRILLTDFGCATSTANKPSRLLTMVGTVGYRAPEVIERSNSKSFAKAMDMWAFGAMVTCLLTGETLDDQGTQGNEISAAVSQRVDEILEAKERWADVEKHAREFIKDLLHVDAKKRMNADQAVSHNWFTEPKKVAVELDRLYARANKYWKPRGETNVVEEIPKIPIQSENTKRQKRFHDSTASEYFKQEQNLPSQMSSKGQKAMGMLHNASAKVPLKENPLPRCATFMMANLANHNYKVVQGNNIFGKHRSMSVKDLSDDEHGTETLKRELKSPELSSQAPETLTCSEVIRETQSGQDIFEMTTPAQTAEVSQDLKHLEEILEYTESREHRAHTMPERHRSMSFSRNAEDQQFYEDAARGIPPFSSAKVLRDKIADKKNGTRRGD